MDAFADNLKRRAHELGISNAEVARRAGLSERRYGNYVSGRREPDLATLVRVAKVLETTPDALLGFGASGRADPLRDNKIRDLGDGKGRQRGRRRVCGRDR